MNEGNLLNLMDFFKPGDTLSEHTFTYNKKDGVKIEGHQNKITIFVNPKKISKVEKLIKDYQSIVDIYLEEDNKLNDTVKIKLNDESMLIERQIP